MTAACSFASGGERTPCGTSPAACIAFLLSRSAEAGHEHPGLFFFLKRARGLVSLIGQPHLELAHDRRELSRTELVVVDPLSRDVMKRAFGFDEDARLGLVPQPQRLREYAARAHSYLRNDRRVALRREVALALRDQPHHL